MKGKIITFESKFETPTKFNSQFHMVKVYIAYAGKNRNFSIISKETFEKMIPSLYGIPIVGEWKEEKEDFGTHGGKIEISDEGIKYIETTKPYGFVDSSATVQWENVEEEDGTVNEYLTTTAFLWTNRYPEVLKVLENKNHQSMEIDVFDGEYSEEEPDYFELLDGEFSALCILGEDVTPAFESAKISQFSLDKEEFKSEFTQMVAELRNSLNFTEGGGNLEDNKTENTEEKVENTEDFTEEVEDEKADEKVDETLEESTDEFEEESDEKVDETEELEEDFEEEKEDETEERFTKTFELSHDDIRSKLYGLLCELEKETDDWYWIMKVYDSYFIYISELEGKYYKQDYTKTDTEVSLKDERVEVFAEFLTASELEELDKMRENYSKIVEENESLKEFKAQKEQEEFDAEQERLRQEKIDHINNEYSSISDDVKEIFVSKVDEYATTADIDADICVYIVKNKLTFSKAKQEKPPAKVGVEESKQNSVISPYGGLFNLKN